MTTDVFRQCRERVSARDAARRYGLRFDRRGWAVCPFHRDRHPSMSFRAGRFRCWACHASGDSIDFTGRLLGRNRWLVDRASILLAVYNGTYRSGTGMTVRYAEKLGREIIVVDPVSRRVSRRV